MLDVKSLHPADQICMILKRIYDMDMTTLTGGNVSIKDDEGVIWVSPTGIDKGSLTREDIVQILPDDTIVGKWRPTSEYRIHVGILRTRPEIKAVLHAHSPALVTMSAVHELPDTKALFPTYEAVGEPGMSEYGMPGTLNLVKCVMETFMEGHDAAVLKNHAVFLGSRISLFDAFARFEQLDFHARIQLNAETEAAVTAQPEEKLKKLQERLKQETKEGTLRRERYTAKELDLRRTLASLAKRANTKKLFGAQSGVISARVDETSFLISPQVRDNAWLSEGDFVLAQTEDCEAGKTADAFRRLHGLIYEMHPEIQSIIMAASEHAAVYAMTGQEYEVALIPESYGVLRSFSHITFDEMLGDWKEIARRAGLEKTPFFALDQVGIMVMGDSPLLTFDKLEVAEGTALSIHYAKKTKKEIKAMTAGMKDEQDGLSE